jgi:hypothetical protein
MINTGPLRLSFAMPRWQSNVTKTLAIKICSGENT